MNLLEELRSEHGAILDMLFQAEQLADEVGRGLLSKSSASRAVREAVGLLESLASRVAEHEERERRFLFPALRELIPRAAAALEASRREDGRIREALADLKGRLKSLSRGPVGEFLTSVRRFVELLRGHIFREEDGIYSMAENGLSPQELEGLAQKAEAIEAPELVDVGGGS